MATAHAMSARCVAPRVSGVGGQRLARIPPQHTTTQEQKNRKLAPHSRRVGGARHGGACASSAGASDPTAASTAVAAAPLTEKDLVDYLRSGCKPKTAWRCLNPGTHRHTPLHPYAVPSHRLGHSFLSSVCVGNGVLCSECIPCERVAHSPLRVRGRGEVAAPERRAG
jgi:hypothetical protein